MHLSNLKIQRQPFYDKVINTGYNVLVKIKK